MKAALIGDIHANLPALEAVLSHSKQYEVELIWNVGDLVGYGPFPDQVVQRLRAIKAVSIIGNYDQKVLQFPQKAHKWSKSKKFEKYLAFQWAYEQLSSLNRAYLESLPTDIRIEIEGLRILLTHGSPASNSEHLTPFTPEKRLKELAMIARADVFLCGHSHQAFSRFVDGVWFINPGSVGRPDDGDPRASYALLDIQHDGISTTFHRLEYDISQDVQEIRKNNLPEAFAEMLLTGRSLDVIVGYRTDTA